MHTPALPPMTHLLAAMTQYAPDHSLLLDGNGRCCSDAAFHETIHRIPTSLDAGGVCRSSRVVVRLRREVGTIGWCGSIASRGLGDPDRTVKAIDAKGRFHTGGLAAPKTEDRLAAVASRKWS